MPDQEVPSPNPDDTALRDALWGAQERERQLAALIATAREEGAELPPAIVRWADEAGTRDGLDLLAREASGRLQAQESLRRSEERYRSVVEHLGEGMVVIQDEVVVFANPQASDILRIAPSGLIGLRSIELLHPDDRAGVAERLARRQGGETLSVKTEIRRLDADGGVRWLETHSTNAHWEGRPATMSFFADATERKGIVEALHRSEQRYRAVVEHVDDGMVVVQGTRFVFVNARAAQLAEMTVEDMLSEGYLHRIHPDDRPIVDERRRRRLAGEEVPNRYEIRLLLPKAGVRWIDIGVTIVPWDGGPGTLTFFSDVTERKVLEARLTSSLQERAATLESSLRRQSELNELRSRFVSMTSHEFRTPLASIQSSAELLRDYGERLPAAEKAQIFQTIEDSVRRMTGMLERVLQIGRADARMLEFHPKPHDLVQLCAALVREVLATQPEVAARVVTDFPANGPLSGQYDETLLRHIVVNLLSNAIKYSPAGGEIRFGIAPDGAFTRLEVSDHGIGIPAAELPHLFEAFHRASNVGAIHGTGLGLAIVKSSVELHGGRIEVRSEPGQGTQFLVWLPAS